MIVLRNVKHFDSVNDWTPFELAGGRPDGVGRMLARPIADAATRPTFDRAGESALIRSINQRNRDFYRR